MMLSHILRNLSDDAQADEALLGLGDLVLIAAVEEESRAHEEARGEYVAGAVRRFARMAGNEDWLAVMGKLERSDKPAEDFLRQTLQWALKRDRDERIAEPAGAHACSCGGGHGHGQTAR
ncbi:MAG: hypothetical protein MUF11_05505 [Beijerinckiaceae bacterium]|jgi:hypothetical protein|nr:hypothetical protein [Beijerinckiaceae bacterium]